MASTVYMYVMDCLGGCCIFFFFQAEDGIRDLTVTGVQTCALPIWGDSPALPPWAAGGGGAPPSRVRLVELAADLRRRAVRSEEHTSELPSQSNLVCRLLL